MALLVGAQKFKFKCECDQPVDDVCSGKSIIIS